MKVVSYTTSDSEAWDEFLGSCFNATFLHSRRFLSYHGSRFEDASLKILNKRGRLVGLFPAAINPSDPKEVVSHPGITYGGIVRGRELQGSDIIQCFEEIARVYCERGFERLLYKAIPTVYQLYPAEDDLYALFRQGAKRTRCDLSAAIDLSRRDGPPARARRALKKASKHGVRVEASTDRYQEFWVILSERLSSRYRTNPAHTLDEIRDLAARFPENIRLAVSLLDSELIAGLVLFETAQAVHAQYSASNETGACTGALELVTESCIRDAALQNKRYFDLGISSEQDGAVLNTGLYEFKTKFGASGIAHEFYSLKLCSR